MKKIYLIAVLVLSAGMTMAQSSVILPQNELITVREMQIPSSAAAVDATDTLGLEDFSQTIGITIEAGGSGYILGTSYVDTTVEVAPGTTLPIEIITEQVATGYILNDPYNVIGAMVWFAFKDAVSADPADLEVKLYSLEDESAIISGSAQEPDGIGPADELASINLPFADIDTSSIAIARTYAFFDDAQWVSGDFALSVDFTALYNDGTEIDTVVLYNEGQGTSDATGEYTWYAQGALGVPLPATWIAMSALGAEFNAAIFAIVAESETGIEEQGFLNGVKMTTYPNPAVSADVITVQYGLENAAEKVTINVYDMNGRIVHTIAEGDKVSGLHNVVIPAGTLSAGSYIYSIEANGGRMAKKLEVLR